MGKPSADYPYPFSIYKWLPGKSINLLTLTAQNKERLAELAEIIDVTRALALWDKACATRWNKQPVWIHGDFSEILPAILSLHGRI